MPYALSRNQLNNFSIFLYTLSFSYITYISSSMNYIVNLPNDNFKCFLFKIIIDKLINVMICDDIIKLSDKNKVNKPKVSL